MENIERNDIGILDAVFDSPDIGYAIFNNDGIIIKINNTFCSYLNLTNSQLLNKSILSYFFSINKIEELFNNKTIYLFCSQNIQYEIITFYNIGDLYFLCIKQKNIQLKGDVDIITKQILNNTLEGIVVLSPSFEVIYWNKFLEEITGIAATDLIGQNLLDFFPLLQKSRIKEHVASILQGNKIEPFEYFFELPITQKSGWCLCNFSCLKENNVPTQVIISVVDLAERKRITKLQHESEEKYKTIFKTCPDAIVVSTLDGIILEVNDGFCRQLGYTRDEVVGFSSKNILLWKNVTDRDVLINALITNGVAENLEFVFITKNGQECICLTSAQIAVLDNEKRIITVTRDISDKKRIEKELQQSKDENSLLIQRYRLISQNISDVIWILDPELMKFTYMSPSISKLRGYSSNDVVNVDLYTLFSDQSAIDVINKIPSLIEDFNKNGEDASTLNFEFQIRHKEGFLLWVEISTRITRNKNGKIEIIGVTRNIDARKKAEFLIQESEMRYRTAFMTSPDGINIVSIDGTFVDVNEGFVNNMGYSKEEIIGKKSDDIKLWVNELDRINMIQELKNKGEVRNLETVFRHKNGDFFTVLMSAKILMINNKPHILSISRDISKRKEIENELLKAKEKAEESDRLKSAFLANMSHEIRTPMNAIKGFADLLTLPDLSEEKKQKFIDVINLRTDDLLMLINDLLDISKIEAGQMVISEHEGNIQDLFNELYALFSSHNTLLSNKNVVLISTIELDKNEQNVKLDFFRLKQILINLINNALKFTKNGKVTFGCKLDKSDTLLFWVNDTGIGIPHNKQSIIFERFRQASDQQTTKIYGGTGLGLSIVKGLTELMKGKVWCSSDEGIGSTFFVSLPFAPISLKQELKNIISNKPDFYDWSDKLILIVEDDAFNAELIHEFIAPTFAKCLHAKNGTIALDLYKNNLAINLVLMDIQLPDISGYEVTRRIKEINKDCIVIAQTAYAAKSDRDEAFEAGCNDYISKPINKNLLLQVMKKYL